MVVGETGIKPNKQRRRKKPLDLIADKGLLEELISYNRERNTDRVMALMGAIIQMKNVFNEYVKEDTQRESVIDWFSDRALYLPSTDNSPEGIYKKRLNEITKRLSIG